MLTVHESRAISRFLVRDNYKDNNMYYTLSQEAGNEMRAPKVRILGVKLTVPFARKKRFRTVLAARRLRQNEVFHNFGNMEGDFMY